MIVSIRDLKFIAVLLAIAAFAIGATALFGVDAASKSASPINDYATTSTEGITLYERRLESTNAAQTNGDGLSVPNASVPRTGTLKEPSAVSEIRSRLAPTLEGLAREYISPTAAEAAAVAAQLAQRAPMQTFVVSTDWDTTDFDLNDNIYSPPTLRSAIQNANKTPGVDEIIFTVPSVNIGALGAIVATQPVILNGSFGGGKVLVSNSGSLQGALWFQGGGCVITNLEFTGFTNAGSCVALLSNSGNPNTVQGCVFHDNSITSINFNFSTNNIIGGLGPGERNVIYNQSGSPSGAISLILSSHNNRIIGNYIGTPDGMTAGPNSRNGIYDESQGNYVGYNVIAANAWSGVSRSLFTASPAFGQVCEYNKIGTTADGLTPMGNGANQTGNGYGANLPNDTVRHNLVSANGRSGIGVGGANSLVEFNVCGLDVNLSSDFGNEYAGISVSNSVLVQDNWCSGNSTGIDVQGTNTGAVVRANVAGADSPARISFGNQFVGIYVSASGSTIGGENPAYGNLVCGNGGDAMVVSGRFTKNNRIINNKIGVDNSGIAAIPNGGNGIRMQFAPDSTTITRNIIAACGKHGIYMTPQTALGEFFRPDGNWIYANLIGIGADSSTALPNHGHGIAIDGGGRNLIGAVSDSGNIIVNSDSSGIAMWGARDNQIIKNFIGVTRSAMAASNQQHGIVMTNSDSNEIGGTIGFVGNVIAGNDQTGISIIGSGSRENLIAANNIGIIYDTLQPALANLIGIHIDGGVRNRIGDKSAEIQNDIVGNSEAGILIVGDSNVVVKNLIRHSIDDAGAVDGEGDGIIIAGFDNRIGGGYPTETNTINDNAGVGVLVVTGEGNTIRGNLIYDNDKLGIDLIPIPHVTKNDSADVDAGANELQNYPVIDSAKVFNAQTTVYGHVESTDDTASIMIEFFKTTDCDTSKYGEGDSFIDSLPAFVIFGRADFTKVFNEEFDSTKKLTMTATNARGSTSEFSACWPAKVIEVTDFLTDYIPEREFELSRMQNDIPTLTETFLGKYTTDNLGLIYLGQEFLDAVDTLKIAKLMDEKPNPKRPTILPIAYRVWLDNGDFDSSSYNLFFSELDSNYTQRIKLTHTTAKYNLLASIEWDASRAYVDSLKQMFRNISNFLYDVGDGQICLDSVMIVDEKLAWSSCDLRLFASNNQWPEAHAGGLLMAESWAKISFPRQQETDYASNRYVSSIYDPPIPSGPNMFRTLAHEFGHYALKFRDEYNFPPPDTVRCVEIANYGFMDRQYQGYEPTASEMSWAAQYQLNACRNTKQYVVNFTNCWYHWEAGIDKQYDNIWAPIATPSDRGVSFNSQSYFFGPNDGGVPTNYDVGIKVGFREMIPAQTGRNRLIRAADALTHQPKGGLKILHYRKGAGYLIEQGLTYDDGRLILLGVQEGDAVFVAGPGYIVPPNPPLPPPPPKPKWNFGSFKATDTSFVPIAVGDTLPARRLFPLTPQAEEEPLDIASVDSLVPMICGGNISAGAVEIELQAPVAISASPNLQVHTDNNDVLGYSTAVTGTTYSATIGDDLADAGTIYAWLLDPEIDSFFFTLDYALEQFSDTLTSVDFAGKHGDVEIDLRFASGGVTRAFVLSTDFPVPYGGLSGTVLPAGRSHAIATHPTAAYDAGSTIAITYDLARVVSSAKANLDPATLSIYRWDEIAAQWAELGGAVDTTQSIITAAISQPGVYAVFAEAAVAGAPCGDADASGRIDIGDAVHMINYIFAGGVAPLDSAGGDWDCSNRTDIGDAVYLINYIFAGGAAPCAACP